MSHSLALLIAFTAQGQAASVNERGAEPARSAQPAGPAPLDSPPIPRPQLNLLIVRINFMRATQVAETLKTLTSPASLHPIRDLTPRAHFAALEHGHFVAIVADADMLPVILKIIAEQDRLGPLVDPSCPSSDDPRASNMNHP